MSSARGVTWVVIAKAPVPGRVKTRLCPPCTPEQAADIARAALQDTLDAVAATPARRRMVALDGDVPAWLPPTFDVVPQRGDGLDERLAAVFDDVHGPTLIVGMDTPQLTPELLSATAEALQRDGTDAVLGPAEDGGYWVIGLDRPDPATVRGVPMSEEHTLDAQRARLDELGLRVHDVDTLRDVDDIDDAVAIAAATPDGRFAAAVRQVVQVPGAAATTTGSPTATSPGLTTST